MAGARRGGCGAGGDAGGGGARGSGIGGRSGVRDPGGAAIASRRQGVIAVSATRIAGARSCVKQTRYGRWGGQSPFDQTTGRCHEEVEQRWQVLRAMHDLGPPRREKPPLTARFPRHASKTARSHPEMDTWGEDLAIFTPKNMHEAKMLPGRGLIARIRGKGDAYGAILASWALGPPQCKEGMRGFMGRRGGWRRWRARRAAGLAGAALRGVRRW